MHNSNSTPYTACCAPYHIGSGVSWHGTNIRRWSDEEFIWWACSCSDFFVGCFISFAQAFVSKSTSQRSIYKYCKGYLHSCMNRSASSSGFCLTDPATLGAGAGLQFVSPNAVQHYPQVFFASGTIPVLSRCNTRSRTVQMFETDFL